MVSPLYIIRASGPTLYLLSKALYSLKKKKKKKKDLSWASGHRRFKQPVVATADNGQADQEEPGVMRQKFHGKRGPDR